MQTVNQIISLWPTAFELAQDLGLKNETHVGVMKHRGSIPVGYWFRLVMAAKERGLNLTYEDLANAHSIKAAVPFDSYDPFRVHAHEKTGEET